MPWNNVGENVDYITLVIEKDSGADDDFVVVTYNRPKVFNQVGN